MYLFNIDENTKVNLESIDSVKMMKTRDGNKMSIVVNGSSFIVSGVKQKELIAEIDKLQKNISLTQQYTAL